MPREPWQVSIFLLLPVRVLEGGGGLKNFINQMRDERGAGTTTFAILLMAILFLLFGMGVDLGKIYIVKVKTLYALEDGLMAGINQVDPGKLARGQIVIDPVRARKTFQSVFTSSAKLDLSGNPLPGNKTYDGQVRIEEFQVYNAYPTYGPRGNYIDRPTVFTRVSIPVKLLVFRFVQPTVNVPVWTSMGANRLGE